MTGYLTVWIKLCSEAEVKESLYYAQDQANSPFVQLERWMEILGSPSHDVWVRFKGVPLHVWREETFSLLGDCVGSTVGVDPATAKKQMLLFGRVKVARDINQTLLLRIFLYLEDLCLPIEVELEK